MLDYSGRLIQNDGRLVSQMGLPFFFLSMLLLPSPFDDEPQVNEEKNNTKYKVDEVNIIVV